MIFKSFYSHLNHFYNQKYLNPRVFWLDFLSQHHTRIWSLKPTSKTLITQYCAFISGIFLVQFLFLVTKQTCNPNRCHQANCHRKRGKKKITIYCMEWWTCHGPHGIVLSKKLSIHMILDAGIRFCLIRCQKTKLSNHNDNLNNPKRVFYFYFYLIIKKLFSPLLFFIRIFF